MPTRNPPRQPRDLIDVVRALIVQVPPDQRPDGLDDIHALLKRLGARARREGAGAIPAERDEARQTLERLLAEVRPESIEPWTEGLHPDDALAQARDLAEAWRRRDGEEVDALLAEFDRLTGGAAEAEQARTDRIRASAQSSIAASLRRVGITPSSEAE